MLKENMRGICYSDLEDLEGAVAIASSGVWATGTEKQRVQRKPAETIDISHRTQGILRRGILISWLNDAFCKLFTKCPDILNGLVEANTGTFVKIVELL